MERTARDPICKRKIEIVCCSAKEAKTDKTLKRYPVGPGFYDSSDGAYLVTQGRTGSVAVWINSEVSEKRIDAVIAHECFHLYTGMKFFMYGEAGIHINTEYDEDDAYHLERLYELVWKVVHDTLKNPKQASGSGPAGRRKVKA
jgi:hypothetical protein